MRIVMSVIVLMVACQVAFGCDGTVVPIEDIERYQKEERLQKERDEELQKDRAENKAQFPKSPVAVFLHKKSGMEVVDVNEEIDRYIVDAPGNERAFGVIMNVPSRSLNEHTKYMFVTKADRFVVDTRKKVEGPFKSSRGYFRARLVAQDTTNNIMLWEADRDQPHKMDNILYTWVDSDEAELLAKLADIKLAAVRRLIRLTNAEQIK